MNHKKNAWVAVITFALALTVIGVGKPAAGGDDNGQIEGIGKLIIKGFGAIDFPYYSWGLAEKDQKKGASEYTCKEEEGCYFYVEIEGAFCNFATANSAGGHNECPDGFVEEAHGFPGPVMEGTYIQFHCEKTAVVTTFNDLLWIPELCYPTIAG